MAELVLAFPQSRRQKLLQRIEARLRSIHPDNGYQLHIPTIVRGKMNPLNFQLYPAVMIIPGNDDPEDGLSSVKRRPLVLVIRLWVRGVPDILDSLEQLMANVQHAMMRDVRWPDAQGQDVLAENTIEGATTYIYLEASNDEMGADIEYEIHYRTSMEDPTREP